MNNVRPSWASTWQVTFHNLLKHSGWELKDSDLGITYWTDPNGLPVSLSDAPTGGKHPVDAQGFGMYKNSFLQHWATNLTNPASRRSAYGPLKLAKIVPDETKLPEAMAQAQARADAAAAAPEK